MCYPLPLSPSLQVKRRRLNLGPSTEGGEDLAVPISRARRLRRARKRRVPLSLFAARSVDEEGNAIIHVRVHVCTKHSGQLCTRVHVCTSALGQAIMCSLVAFVFVRQSIIHIQYN